LVKKPLQKRGHFKDRDASVDVEVYDMSKVGDIFQSWDVDHI
jgi:hypothetical protein